jgi:hypothetical protein
LKPRWPAAEDAQLVAHRNFSFADVARLFMVPPFRLAYRPQIRVTPVSRVLSGRVDHLADFGDLGRWEAAQFRVLLYDDSSLAK